MSRRKASGRVPKNAQAAVAPATPVAPPSTGTGALPLIVGGIALLGAFLWSYWPTLVEIVERWSSEPDYSHGFLVVPLSLFFLWTNRHRFPVGQIRPSLWGASLLLIACGLRIAAGLFFVGSLDGWTIPLWVAGAVWLLYGWQCLLWSAPAIVFLGFMVPIPFAAEHWFSVSLQTIATKLSTICLVMLGQPALAEGNTIWIGEHHLMVEEACSGLRIFVGIFALAFAFALFSSWSWWQKLLVLVAAFPIAIIANVTRIVITALLHEFASSDFGRQFSHDLSGIVMIPFAAGLMWLFLIYLDRLFPKVQQVSAVEVEWSMVNPQ